METFLDLVLRSASTLIATLLTVIIITERQRRINNAKIELAARYVESIQRGSRDPDLIKEVVHDLRIAEEVIRDIAWGQIARASKIDDIVHITRKLAHVRQKHEKLAKDDPEQSRSVLSEIEEKKFEVLAATIRSLKISFIDFVFITSAPKREPEPADLANR